ncbi:MAG: hypothetical protein WBQ37_15480 [Candidatus Competibacter sp.]
MIDRPDGSGTLAVRRLRVPLNEPTRDGDDIPSLLTTVPVEAADACTLARLYRERWTIEKAFLHWIVQRRCEINTLAYPPAALFGLVLAVVADNGLAVIKATLRQVYGAEAIDARVSGDYLVHEMARVAETLIEPRDGAVLQTLTLATRAAWLITTAGHAQLRKYRKHPRGPRKPPSRERTIPANPMFPVMGFLFSEIA